MSQFTVMGLVLAGTLFIAVRALDSAAARGRISHAVADVAGMLLGFVAVASAWTLVFWRTPIVAIGMTLGTSVLLLLAIGIRVVVRRLAGKPLTVVWAEQDAEVQRRLETRGDTE